MYRGWTWQWRQLQREFLFQLFVNAGHASELLVRGESKGVQLEGQVSQSCLLLRRGHTAGGARGVLEQRRDVGGHLLHGPARSGLQPPGAEPALDERWLVLVKSQRDLHVSSSNGIERRRSRWRTGRHEGGQENGSSCEDC